MEREKKNELQISTSIDLIPNKNKFPDGPSSVCSLYLALSERENYPTRGSIDTSLTEVDSDLDHTPVIDDMVVIFDGDVMSSQYPYAQPNCELSPLHSFMLKNFVAENNVSGSKKSKVNRHISINDNPITHTYHQDSVEDSSDSSSFSKVITSS